jgi:hypothetical protein
VVGAIACFARGFNGLGVLDVSDPTDPVYVGNVSGMGTVVDLEVNGNTAVVRSNNGLHTVDLTIADSPTRMGHLPMRTLPSALGATAQFAYVATEYRAVEVVSISDPYSIKHFATHFFPGEANAIAVGPAAAFVVSEYGPLQAIPVQCVPGSVGPARATLVTGRRFGSVGDGRRSAPSLSHVCSAPNPFRENTNLFFSIGEPAPTRLTVYDVAGRMVRVLVDGALPEGDHEVAWDGRDDAGVSVSPGSYFARIDSNGRTRTRKLIFLGRH